MISTTLGGVSTQFNYNGDGARLRQVAAGTPTTYTQDLAAPLPVVLQSRTGATTTSYEFSNGTRPIGQFNAGGSGTWGYLLPDALGSVRQIAALNGSLTLAKTYDPYGSVVKTNGSGTSIFGYSGEQADASGLIYLRARYMQPKLGIFLSEDTVPGIAASPQSQHLFTYAWDNPVNRIDPRGQQQPPPQCNFGDICATGPTGPYVTQLPPHDYTYNPQKPYPAGDDPVFGGPDFLGSLSPILPFRGFNWYDPLGLVTQSVAKASDQYQVPREFVAAALNYENHQQKGFFGAIGRLLKQIGTACLQPFDDLTGRYYDNGLGPSMGIGNVKPQRADDLERYFLTHYDAGSPEYADMAKLQPVGDFKISNIYANVSYVAADMRYAVDAIYDRGYEGPISKEGVRRIIGAHNQPQRSINGAVTEAGNEGIELLIQASRGEIPLQFFPGR